MLRILARSSAVFVATIVLASCGGSDGSDEGKAKDDKASSQAAGFETDVDSASGDTVKGEGFTVTAPKGWVDIKDKLPGFNPEVARSAPKPEDGFSTNFNVLKDPNGGDDLDAYTKTNIQQLEAMGFTEVETQESAGDFGVVTSRGQQNATKFKTRQYYALRDGAAYVITFSFADSIAEDQALEVSESVMKTWKWS